MGDLSRFQDAFCDALEGDTTTIAPWLVTAPSEAPGLAVYRNTVAKGAIDVLAATYTTVQAMVGEDWLRAAASVYANDHRPSAPSLLAYGAEFPDWLADFPPASDTPYLPAIARLDRLWWESYFSTEAPVLDPVAFSELGADDLETTGVALHPSVRLAAYDETLPSLWLAHRSPNDPLSGFEIDDRAEAILIVRAGLTVNAQLISHGAYVFLSACLAGESLLAAAERAAAADPDSSFPDIINAALESGVLCRLERVRQGLPS